MRGLLVVGLTLLLTTPAWGVPKEDTALSLDQAMDIAMKKNPQVLAAQQGVTTAEAQLSQQKNWLLRSITANIGYNPNIGGFGAQGGLGMAVNVGDLLNGPLQSRVAYSNVETAKQNLRQVRLAVAAQITATYADYTTQRQIAEIRQEAIKAAQNDVKVIERLFARGQASISDVTKVRLAVSQSRIDLSVSEGNLKKAWMALLQQMGETGWLDEAVVRR